MCATTLLTIASVGMKIAEGVQANSEAEAAARQAEQEARLARQQAAAGAMRHLDASDAERGRYLARAGSDGVDLAQGSTVDAAAKISERGYRDFLTTLHGGEVEGWRHDVRAANARYQGRAALEKSIFGAGISLLGMAASQSWSNSGKSIAGDPRTLPEGMAMAVDIPLAVAGYENAAKKDAERRRKVAQ